MTKNNIIAVVLAAGAGGFILALVVMGRPEPKAATTLAGFLLLVLVALGTVGAGVAAAPEWLKQRKRRAQLEEAERLAQVLGALGGERPQRPTARRPAQVGPTIYVVGGNGRAETGTVEDLARVLGLGQ